MSGRRTGGRSLLLVAALAAAGLSGCSPYSGTGAQRVQQWVRQMGFAAHHDLLISDVSRLREAVKIGTAQQVRTICGGMAVDVGNAYGTLPTPDQSLTDDLNAADTALLDAATSCSGVSSATSPTIRTDLAEIRSGLGDLERAQRRLAALGVTWRVKL